MIEGKYVTKERSGERFSCRGYNIVQLYGDSGTFDFSPYYGNVDFMFIDGSHAYDYVKNDTLAALKMVRVGGTIIWHDYRRTGFTPFPGVLRALTEFFLTDGRFSTLSQIDRTSIVHLRVPDLQSYSDFEPRLLGDSTMAKNLIGQLSVFANAKSQDASSISVRIVAQNTGSAVWLPSDNAVGSVRVGVRVLGMTGKLVDPDYRRLTIPFRRAVFPGETVDFADKVPRPNRRCILEFDLVAEGVSWFNLPDRPRIVVEKPRRFGLLRLIAAKLRALRLQPQR
jgi:hypothetical protein